MGPNSLVNNRTVRGYQSRGGEYGVPSFYPCPTSARRSWAERTDGLRGETRSLVSLGKSALALARPPCDLPQY